MQFIEFTGSPPAMCTGKQQGSKREMRLTPIATMERTSESILADAIRANDAHAGDDDTREHASFQSDVGARRAFAKKPAGKTGVDINWDGSRPDIRFPSAARSAVCNFASDVFFALPAFQRNVERECAEYILPHRPPNRWEAASNRTWIPSTGAERLRTRLPAS